MQTPPPEPTTDTPRKHEPLRREPLPRGPLIVFIFMTVLLIMAIIAFLVGVFMTVT